MKLDGIYGIFMGFLWDFMEFMDFTEISMMFLADEGKWW